MGDFRTVEESNPARDENEVVKVQKSKDTGGSRKEKYVMISRRKKQMKINEEATTKQSKTSKDNRMRF